MFIQIKILYVYNSIYLFIIGSDTGPYIYELFAVLIHQGTATHGHYYAYIKDFRNEKWQCFNDDKVTHVIYTYLLKFLIHHNVLLRWTYYYFLLWKIYLYLKYDWKINVVMTIHYRFPSKISKKYIGMME